MLNDPFLRRFFGLDEDEEEPGGPPSRHPRQRQEEGLGAGVIVSANGYILSNSHVVEGDAFLGLRENTTRDLDYLAFFTRC